MNIDHLNEWDMIENQFNMSNRDTISEFLVDRTFLAQLLLELPEKIPVCFPDSQLSLEIWNDPEIEDNAKLLALIRTKLDPEEALDVMESFDREWWIENRPRTQGELVIDVEFA